MDVLLWFGCGFAAAVLVGLWYLFMPGPVSDSPSSIIGGLFFVVVLGPIALFVIGMATALMLIIATLEFIGYLIDEAYESRSAGRHTNKPRVERSWRERK